MDTFYGVVTFTGLYTRLGHVNYNYMLLGLFNNYLRFYVFKK